MQPRCRATVAARHHCHGDDGLRRQADEQTQYEVIPAQPTQRQGQRADQHYITEAQLPWCS
jgi:hypothetical protein